jgi:pimeloyl-ACP methyl ester carboxylesterase
MAVLAMASAFPEEIGHRVRGAVLADTGSADLLKEALGDAAVRATASVRRALLALGGRPAAGERARRFALGPGRDLAFLAARVTNFAPGAPPSVVEHVARVSANTPVEVWPECLISMLDLDIRDAESALSVPTLVVAGDHDRLTPPSGARRLAASLPNGRFAEIPGAAHVSMMEQPAAFNEAVESFLASLPTTAKAPVQAAP